MYMFHTRLHILSFNVQTFCRLALGTVVNVVNGLAKKLIR